MPESFIQQQTQHIQQQTTLEPLSPFPLSFSDMVKTKIHKPKTRQKNLPNKKWSCTISPQLSKKIGAEKNDHLRIKPETTDPCYLRIRGIHNKNKYPLRTPKKTRKTTSLKHHEKVEISKTIPQEEYIEARKNNGLAETVWDNKSQENILVYAPHGGDIEFGTDDAAIRLCKKLRENGYSCSLWALHGFGDKSFSRWHASKPGLTNGCYPGLDQVSNRSYDLVVSFHVQNEGYTGVGGRVGDEFRRRVAEELGERIRDRYDFRWRHEDMKWKGVSDSNLVNSLCSGAGGLQVEFQPIIGYKYRVKAVESVFEVVEEMF